MSTEPIKQAERKRAVLDAHQRASFVRAEFPNAMLDQSRVVLSYEAALVAAETESARLGNELKAAIGYMTNAALDLQTGAPKKTALDTLNGGIVRARRALEQKPDTQADIASDLSALVR